MYVVLHLYMYIYTCSLKGKPCDYYTGYGYYRVKFHILSLIFSRSKFPFAICPEIAMIKPENLDSLSE